MFNWIKRFFKRLGVDTTTTTLTEMIPTIVATALLGLEEGNIIQPLITNVDFPGPGIVHQTPIISKLTANLSDAPTAEAMDSGSSSADPSPASATVGIHSAYVQLKDLCNLGSVGDMAAAAGQLIGQSLVTLKDTDLLTLFTSFITEQGSASGATTLAIAPADLYDAYGALRKAFAPLPYHLVMSPKHIWGSLGLVSLFDNSSDAVQSFGVGTVGEDFARYGFAGMVMGFNLWADANIPMTTDNGSGAAFSREAIKNVTKRAFQIEIQRDVPKLADGIVGSEIRGEGILRNSHGNGMSFYSP